MQNEHIIKEAICWFSELYVWHFVLVMHIFTMDFKGLDTIRIKDLYFSNSSLSMKFVEFKYLENQLPIYGNYSFQINAYPNIP